MSLVLAGRGDVTLHRISESAMVVYDRSSRQIAVLPSQNPVPPVGEDNTCPACGQTLHNDRQDLFPEYFHLLQRLGAEETISQSGISSQSLSQGYFDRFFKSLGILGRGSRATVLLVEHVLDGVSIGKFALKKVPVGDDHKWLERVLAEVHLLRQLSHQNLVKYNHVWLEISSTSSFGPQVPCAYILQEYCEGGTLENYVFQRKTTPIRRLSSGGPDQLAGEEYQRSQDGRLSVYEIKRFMQDIVSGLAYLHEQGFVHRDLKPSNYLLHYKHHDALPTVLVSDFGESQVEGANRMGTGSTGTLEYCAPELLQAVNGKLPPFSRSSDMFSVGMSLHFLCFSALPYSDAWEANGDLDALKSEVKQFAFNLGKSNQIMRRSDLGGLVPLMRELLGPPEGRPDNFEILLRLDKVEVTPPPLPSRTRWWHKRATLRVLKIVSVLVVPAPINTLRILGALGAVECMGYWPLELFLAHMTCLAASILWQKMHGPV